MLYAFPYIDDLSFCVFSVKCTMLFAYFLLRSVLLNVLFCLELLVDGQIDFKTCSGERQQLALLTALGCREAL